MKHFGKQFDVFGHLATLAGCNSTVVVLCGTVFCIACGDTPERLAPTNNPPVVRAVASESCLAVGESTRVEGISRDLDAFDPQPLVRCELRDETGIARIDQNDANGFLLTMLGTGEVTATCCAIDGSPEPVCDSVSIRSYEPQASLPVDAALVGTIVRKSTIVRYTTGDFPMCYYCAETASCPDVEDQSAVEVWHNGSDSDCGCRQGSLEDHSAVWLCVYPRESDVRRSVTAVDDAFSGVVRFSRHSATSPVLLGNFDFCAQEERQVRDGHPTSWLDEVVETDDADLTVVSSNPDVNVSFLNGALTSRSCSGSVIAWPMPARGCSH